MPGVPTKSITTRVEYHEEKTTTRTRATRPLAVQQTIPQYKPASKTLSITEMNDAIDNYDTLNKRKTVLDTLDSLIDNVNATAAVLKRGSVEPTEERFHHVKESAQSAQQVVWRSNTQNETVETVPPPQPVVSHSTTGSQTTSIFTSNQYTFEQNQSRQQQEQQEQQQKLLQQQQKLLQQQVRLQEEQETIRQRKLQQQQKEDEHRKRKQQEEQERQQQLRRQQYEEEQRRQRQQYELMQQQLEKLQEEQKEKERQLEQQKQLSQSVCEAPTPPPHRHLAGSVRVLPTESPSPVKQARKPLFADGDGVGPWKSSSRMYSTLDSRRSKTTSGDWSSDYQSESPYPFENRQNYQDHDQTPVRTPSPYKRPDTAQSQSLSVSRPLSPTKRICAYCDEYIDGPCITALAPCSDTATRYHPHHFVCSYCLKALNLKGTYKEHQKKPYCHECFYRLYSGPGLIEGI